MGYCSPERARSSQHPGAQLTAEPSFDVWSLGVILFKLIYHKHPFRKKIDYSKTKLDEY